MKFFLIGRIKSLKYALKGMFLLLKTEHAIISQSLISIIFIVLGFYFEISRFEWVIQLFLMGFVLAIESLNTAVESICDFIHPDFNEHIGFIKDIAAGAVCFAVIFAMLIELVIYFPYIF